MKKKRNFGLLVTLGLCTLILITFFSIWVYYLSKEQDISNEKPKTSTVTNKTSSVSDPSSSSEKTSKRKKASSTTIIFSESEGQVPDDGSPALVQIPEDSSSSKATSSSEEQAEKSKRGRFMAQGQVIPAPKVVPPIVEAQIMNGNDVYTMIDSHFGYRNFELTDGTQYIIETEMTTDEGHKNFEKMCSSDPSKCFTDGNYLIYRSK